MSKIKFASAALFMFAAANSAFGQTTPMTIQEWKYRQGEIKRAEMDWKLEEQKRKLTGNGSPAQIARTCDDELALYAVYGIGTKLRADFGFRGATVTLAAGEKIDVGGWYVEELTPTRAVMIKRSSGKISARCPVYLSTTSHPVGTGSAIATVSTDTQVPPIVAASGNATPTAKTSTAQGSAK